MYKQQTSLTPLPEIYCHVSISQMRQLKDKNGKEKYFKAHISFQYLIFLLISIGIGGSVASRGGTQNMKHSQLVEIVERCSFCSLTQPEEGTQF